MKIYFGRIPDCKLKFVDDRHLFPLFLMCKEYNYTKAVEELIVYMEYEVKHDNVSFYTCNPLILNYFDDEFANKYLFFIDDNGNEIKFGEDESCQKKLKFMGPGEVLCDDSRTFN